MSYYLSKKVNVGFDEAIENVTAALKEEGFGVLTDIDMKATFKKKLDVDFRNYRILGACNPNFAFKAVGAEPNIGLMLPCNVIVQEHEDSTVEVAAVDPVASMSVVGNNSLGSIAADVQERLKKVINSL